MGIGQNFEMISLFVLILVFVGLLTYSIISNYSLKRNLYFNKELFKDLFLHVKEDILFVDPKGMIIFVNKEAQDILRLDIKEGKTHVSDVLKVKGFYCEEDLDCFDLAREKVQVAFKGYMIKEETQGKHLVTGTLIPMFFPKLEFRGSVIVLRDVTQEKRSEEIIYNVTNYDRVTGIPNKNYFMDYLNLSVQTAKIENKMMALFIIDLDNFKTVNDIMGHSVGDELLRKVANGIKDVLEHGSQISRIGGDEFTVVIPAANRINDILAISRRLMNLFTDPWELAGKEYYITCSIGIAVCPHDGEDLENLLRNADTALNNAKDSGKNNYKFYTRTMNTSITERFDVENRLRYAVERDQFVLHYQPIIDAKTLEIHSCEALVRWQHPINGLVSPIDFITIAEDTGLINALGELVLKKACMQHKDWINEGLPPIKISVNFSGKQFRDSNLLQMIKRLLEETQMDTKYLEVEITESFAMHNIDHVIYILNELKKMGISIAVDDFGTGYSSVKYLKLLPIDVLKIDKSFISDVEISNAQKEIVKALISLAHGINLKVTAEGVETMEQLNFLKHHRCDKIQGFIFSKPLPADKFSDFYTKEWQKNEELIPFR
jgi:polar amino acid transport system substrate-binding protein